MAQRSIEIKSTEMMIIKAKHDYCQFFHKLKNESTMKSKCHQFCHFGRSPLGKGLPTGQARGH